MDNFEFENKKKKKLKKGPIYIVLCLFCLMIGAAGGYFLRGSFETTHQKKQDIDSLYNQIGQTIESDFLDTTENQSVLKERMMAGMVAALGDPHSTYMSAQQAQELDTSINGSFEGIGITYIAIAEGAIVLDVYEGTPAQKAGILAGDILTHVQGTAIAGYTSTKIKNVVQGENGTDVSLQLLRDGKKVAVKVKRGNVETSVSHEVRTANNQKIGYLKITTFGESTAQLIETALQDFQKQKIENLVIDLRDNGGGYLDAAKEILDLFIQKNEVLVQVEPKIGKNEVYKSTDREKYTFDKGFILVNGDTASASEVMAGALKELLGYQLVGVKTYGKGTVQTQKTLSDSSVIKYTHAKWLTPKGVWVNGEGLKPDYEVNVKTMNDFSVGKMEKEYGYDQVDNNVQYMQEMLKELGYHIDRTDGYFSQVTVDELKAFEKKYGLTVNGIYEQNDATILLSALGYHIYQQLEDKQYLKIIDLLK